ncbi:MAG: ATP synthase subunit I [Acidimicrobiia bacterium]|nr:ATP synthase subunit I [Acidimicrobiia bacterium]MBT8214124.1 ATP synthase subunit I [Acidimicrobiia bacterium]NNF68256.1 ATP synthase subunit I [Acidimicrobiia bacterium]NNK92554.1 ATP synthase subunit I [Acidimicrobiia bacterium]
MSERPMTEPRPLTTRIEGPDVEAVIARHMVARVVWVAPVLVAVFWVIRGSSGGLGALAGVAIVAGNFLLAGYLLSKTARISLGLYHAAALIGFFLRLGLIAGSMLLVAAVTDVDRPAMAISALVGYLVLLTWETVAVSKGAEKELEWSSN